MTTRKDVSSPQERPKLLQDGSGGNRVPAQQARTSIPRPKRSRRKRQADEKKAPEAASQPVLQTTSDSQAEHQNSVSARTGPAFNMASTPGTNSAPVRTPPPPNWAQIAASQAASTNKAPTRSAPCNLRQRKTLPPLQRGVPTKSGEVDSGAEQRFKSADATAPDVQNQILLLQQTTSALEQKMRRLEEQQTTMHKELVQELRRGREADQRDRDEFRRVNELHFRMLTSLFQAVFPDQTALLTTSSMSMEAHDLAGKQCNTHTRERPTRHVQHKDESQPAGPAMEL